MRKTILIGSAIVLATMLCSTVQGATKALSKTTPVSTNAVQINITNDKTELCTIVAAVGNAGVVTISGMSTVSASNGVAYLAAGGSITFSAGANSNAGLKLYGVDSVATANRTNSIYCEQWIQ